MINTFIQYISFHVSKDNLLLNAEPLVEARDSDSGSEDERHSTTKVNNECPKIYRKSVLHLLKYRFGEDYETQEYMKC